MRKSLLAAASLAAALGTGPAAAQSVQQSGAVTRNHAAIWNSNGVIQDAGSANDSPLSSLGVTNEGGTGFCVSSQRASAAGRNQLCLSAATAGPATISLQNYGTALAQPLQYVINGTTVTIPTGGGAFIFGSPPFTAGNVPCFLNASGTIQDCGLALSGGVVTAGTWQGTPVGIAFGGTGTSTASGARANLGLGSIATQNAASVAITGGAITGMPSPSANSDVATKSYVDATASGLNILSPSTLATAAVLPNTPSYANGTLGVGATLTAGANTTLTVDSTSAPLNTVVLVKNQASGFQNGIYQVTQAGSGSLPWILTRVSYFDQAAEMKAGSYSFITSGVANVNSAFTLQTAVATVGTDPVTFVQFSTGAAGTVTSVTIAAGTGISATGSCVITSVGSCTISNTGVTSVATDTGLLGGPVTTTGTLRVDPTALRQSFGGRLTLVAGQPYMNSDQIGIQNLFYSPDGGRAVPVRVAGNWALYPFTSGPTDQTGLTLALAGSADWAADSIHDVFAIVDGGTLKLATRLWDAGMYPTTAAIANATLVTTGTTPTAWTRASNAFNGTPAQGSANSATINPANPGATNCLGQDYGVGVTRTVSQVTVTAPTDRSLTNGGAVDFRTYGSADGASWILLGINWINDVGNGTVYTLPINLSAQAAYRFIRTCFDGDGTHGIFIAQIAYASTVAPAAGRRLTFEDGIAVNDAAMTARIAAGATVTVAQYAGSLLGVIHIDTASNGALTAHLSWGPSRTFGVWNNYHQVPIRLQGGVPSSIGSYVATSQVFVPCQSSATFSAQVLSGLADSPVILSLPRLIFINAQAAGAGYEGGIAVDNNSAFSGASAGFVIDTTGQALGTTLVSNLTLPPYAGIHTMTCVERINNGAGTVSLDSGVSSTALLADFRG